ncbi:hypothetical protein, partial [uncultured Bacteroides sp.]|uniref:hypothetical protein n=1 Tax=uncultured Bacteroides sp. TaxID=162156 RepID=UPI00262E4828
SHTTCFLRNRHSILTSLIKVGLLHKIIIPNSRICYMFITQPPDPFRPKTSESIQIKLTGCGGFTVYGDKNESPGA